MRSVVDRNVVMRGVPVLQWLGCGVAGPGPVPGGKGDFPFSATVSKQALGLTQPQISLVPRARQPQSEGGYLPPLVSLSIHGALPILFTLHVIMLTFRRSIGLQSEGIKFAVNVRGLRSHLTSDDEIVFCDITIVPTHDEMTSHAARWPTSPPCVKLSLHGRRRFSRSRYASCLFSSATELSIMVDQ